MAGDTPNKQHDEVRRRSTQGERPLEDVPTGTNTIPGPQRSASDSARMSSSGTDLPPRTTIESPRVRFSSDIERRPSLPRKYKNSDEAIPQLDKSQPSSPKLSLDTVNLNEQAPGSPASIGSPDPDRPRSPRSGRHRGLSLRSTIFHKNVRDKSADGRSVVELGEIGTSSTKQIAQKSTGKKSSETTVEITPVEAPKRTERNAGWRKIKASYHKARKLILRINEIPPSKDGRHIDLDPSRKDSFHDERTGKHYLGNTIRSSRYNLWNFFPRQLWAQFSKLANFYFLVISIFQVIPGLSTTGQFTTIVPLMFFVMLSIGKEGYDDLRRYRLDKVENNQEATVLKSEHDELDPWKKVKWLDIKVGDVIKLDRDEAIPADLVLLNSKGPNGIANVETMALDGETNLKSKQVHPYLAKSCAGPRAIADAGVHFVVEDPNLDLYNFEGKVTYQGKTAPLTNNEIMYRGSVLRNTPEATGMVIYSGEECKIRMNANKNPRIKAPHLQKIVNRIVIIIVIFVVALSLFNTIAYQVWKNRVEEPSWYLSNATVAFFPVMVSFIIMFNTMIPLSLYVSLEIVKLCQMLLLNDIDMYDEVTNTPFEARTSTINEELGQISYIFSDKTGTLTDNLMKFRKISVAGTSWLHDVDLHDKADEQLLIHKKRKVKKSKGKKPATQPRMSFNHPFEDNERTEKHETAEGDGHRTPRKSTSQWHSSARPDKAQPELSTTVLIGYIQRRPHSTFAKKARMLLLAIALCHTCLPERDEEDNIDFQASSPDELALVRAAKELDFWVWNRDAGTLTLKLYPNGKDAEPTYEEYEMLDVVEFSSKRKRMSVLVRFPDGRIAIICKGADSIVMERLRLATLARQKTNQIEARVNRRKSLEAQAALRRRSEQVEHGRPSNARSSLSLGRKSFGAIGRTSMTAKLQPIRDEVDNWLNEREHDVSAPPEDVDEYYTPRPSMHGARKQSMAASEMSSLYDEDDELVEESLAANEDAVIERCFQHINDFATEGLRTLLYGHRFLEQEEYDSWKKIYLDATTSLVDRQLLIEKAGELIEQDFELTGATAIEDKLQHGVPEAIDKLRRANIKMWMLTGDKRETAINIGHSCRLIKDYSTVTVLDKELGQLEQHIAAAILDVASGSLAHSVIVIDGQTLATVESEPPLRKLFLDLAISADSVICCRASPSQKSGLVKAIRRRVKDSITLAIGDGANDIAMIQEAHVGIGITGREGLQAARVSDYSIAQFRFLVKLLLVHGRWNYVRVSKYTVGTFWKEIVFYLVQALYQRYTGYTGTSYYESWSLSLFNTLFTSLCVIFLGIFEKDLSAPTLLAVPELYTKGQRNEAFNFKVYLSWMFMGASESIIIFFVSHSLYGLTQFSTHQDLDLFATGDIAFSACVILINLKLQAIEIHNKSVMALIANFCSIGGWFLWNMILSNVYADNRIYFVRDGFMGRFGRNPAWWAALTLAVAAVLLFEVAVRGLKAAFFPTDTETFQALERDLGVRKRFEEAAAMELQQGWRRGGKRSSGELEREREREEEERRARETPRRRNLPDPALDSQTCACAKRLMPTPGPGERRPEGAACNFTRLQERREGIRARGHEGRE
ncbi:hypothetical protein BDZ85DRAFT_272555 [Elsinoe ampelina]|uniref:Phospholipid-transporting ATPase n=1 Tax=Elsinoe ampelina TaxID=302913 RepID=A0A6A6GJP4_9PEZI|nr:hypothetical protein BDZ85DRAFT_272555 [Elsinoe ampelina]